MGRDIFFYSLSIDPETDTPERLKEYADTFGAGPGWLFLTGKPEDIHAIRHKLGERSKVLSDHRNEILLGNGATGEWARNNVLGDLDSLALTVRSMDPAWRRSAGKQRVRPKVSISISRRGRAKPCSSGCARAATRSARAIAWGRICRASPSAGIATGSSNFIANPERMRRQKDPLALALAAKYPTSHAGHGHLGQRCRRPARLPGYATKPPRVPLEPLAGPDHPRRRAIFARSRQRPAGRRRVRVYPLPGRLPDHPARLVERAGRPGTRRRPAEGAVRFRRHASATRPRRSRPTWPRSIRASSL